MSQTASRPPEDRVTCVQCTVHEELDSVLAGPKALSSTETRPFIPAEPRGLLQDTD